MLVNIHEAKTNFSKLVARVADGEEIVIGRRGTPIARLVPLAARPRSTRRPGRAGRITVADAVDDTSVAFDVEVDGRLRREARRQSTTPAALVQAAVQERYGAGVPPRRLSFIGVGDSGLGDASERIDEYLAEDFGADPSASE